MKANLNVQKLAKMVRAKRGTKSQRSIAKELGTLTGTTLGRIERGRVPDLETYGVLCDWLGVNLDHFSNRKRVPKKDELNIENIVEFIRNDERVSDNKSKTLITVLEMVYFG